MADLLVMALLGMTFVGALSYVRACASVLQPVNPTQDHGR